MKQIELTQGKFAIVDDEDYEYLRQFDWYYNNGYARRTIHFCKNGKWDAKAVWMHRLINNTPEDMKTDHINGDGIDNRKENLRTCTNSENLRNRGKTKVNKLGFKGVKYSKRKHKEKTYSYIVAQININGKVTHLGCFKTPEAAARAYNKAALKHHGDFAQLNEVA